MHIYIYIYITRKASGDTVANYGCNKAVVDNTRIKNINYRTFQLPKGSLLQRFSTIYNEFQNYSSEYELLNHAITLYFHISKSTTDCYEKPCRWHSQLQLLNDRIPTIINFIAHLSVRSIFPQLFYLHPFNY